MNHYFIGLPIPGSIQKHLSAVETLPLHSFQQITHRADYHITLFFLGAVQEERRVKLAARMKDLAAYFSPFEIRLDAAGVFGRESSPRVLWAGVERSSSLVELQSSVAEQCEEEGFRRGKRKYQPHITLRKRWIEQESFQLNDIKRETAVWNDLAWTARHFVLYRVHPRETPRYQEVGYFPFGGK